MAQSRLRPKQRWVRVVLWFAALFALLFFVLDQLGEVLTLIAGLLLFAAGVGFVIAPLVRRQAGTPDTADAQLLHRTSFLIGLAVTLAGMALTGYGIYLVVEHAISVAH